MAKLESIVTEDANCLYPLLATAVGGGGGGTGSSSKLSRFGSSLGSAAGGGCSGDDLDRCGELRCSCCLCRSRSDSTLAAATSRRSSGDMGLSRPPERCCVSRLFSRTVMVGVPSWKILLKAKYETPATRRSNGLESGRSGFLGCEIKWTRYVPVASLMVKACCQARSAVQPFCPDSLKCTSRPSKKSWRFPDLSDHRNTSSCSLPRHAAPVAPDRSA
jgi:hypothetical protein